MTVIHMNTRKGVMLSQDQIKRYVEKSAGSELYAVFSEYNLDPAEAYAMAQRVYGGISPDTTIWGSKNTGKLVADSFHSILGAIRDQYVRKFGDEALVQKALTSTSASVFIPTIIAPEIVDIVAKKMPFNAMVPRKPMTSSTMQILRRATDQISNIDFTASGSSEGDTLTPIDQAYTKLDITAKLLFVAGKVSHFAQQASQETADLYAQEVTDHFIDMQGFKEKAMISAQITTGGTYAGHFVAANGYDGIIKRIEDGAPSNFTSLSSQTINLGHIDTLLENILANNGEPSAIICDRSTFTRIRTLARDSGYLTENITNFGYPGENFAYNGVPVFASNFMSRTTNKKAAFAFDVGAVEMRSLMMDTYFEVAQDLSPSKKFFFETFETFVVTAPEQASAVVNGA